MAASPTVNRLFVFGLGFSALALTRRLKPQGWRIAGTCRSEAKATTLAQEGIEVFLFDRGRNLGDASHALAGTTHLLSSVPPDDLGDPTLDAHEREIRTLPGLAWIGYLSTTGVYGDRGGGWVDENSRVRPRSLRATRRVAAESRWLDLHTHYGRPVHVFRLAGIYGPGRSALDQLRAGTARRIVKPGQYFSRIHVEDIAAVLAASMARPNGGGIYNVCDDEPAPPQDVVAYASELLGVAPPPEIAYETAAPEMSEMALSFYADNRRVANRRIKEELGVRLAYPDFRAGLRGLMNAS